jgi:hypothetical protein
VLQKTVSKEGWRGMYKGLTVTLAKVVPAVSISYVVRPASTSALFLKVKIGPLIISSF